MKQEQIITKWNNFIGNYDDAWSNTKVYWAAEHARAWDVHVHGNPVDLTTNYVWLYKIPSHARITFNIIKGSDLDGMDSGLYHVSELNPVVNQGWLEYNP